MIQDIFPKQLDNQYRGERTVGGDCPVLHFLGRRFLCRLSGENGLSFPTQRELAAVDGARVYAFAIDETWYFLLWHDGEIALDGYEYRDVDLFRTARPKDAAYAAVTAFHLSNWYSDNRICGRCGGKTVHDGELRMMKCPDCGAMIFPKIMPSVIVAVTHGDKLLLTKYNRPGARRFALIAGFTELGETVEETVHREVLEEVGLRVKNLRYYKSQPWGISGGGLLLGFWCEVDGGDDIHVDGVELAEGAWVSRAELKETYEDAGIALTGEMIAQFMAGNNPQ